MSQEDGTRFRRRPRASRFVRVLVRVAGMLLVAFLAVCWSIGSGVHTVSQAALREHPGDKVSALMAQAESDSQAVRDRDRAVWALGQLGDSRALPLLQRLSADERTELSRHELKKAVALCKGGFNLGACVWRHGAWGV